MQSIENHTNAFNECLCSTSTVIQLWKEYDLVVCTTNHVFAVTKVYTPQANY